MRTPDQIISQATVAAGGKDKPWVIIGWMSMEIARMEREIEQLKLLRSQEKEASDYSFASSDAERLKPPKLVAASSDVAGDVSPVRKIS